MNLDVPNAKNDWMDANNTYVYQIECLRFSRYNMNDEWYKSNAMKM